MKLLFFSDSLRGGGAERVLTVVCKALAYRGHDITIVLNKNEIEYDLDSRWTIVTAPYLPPQKKEGFVKRTYRRLKNQIRIIVNTRNCIRKYCPDAIVTFLHCNMEAILLYHGQIPIFHSEHNAYDRKLGGKGWYRRFFLNRFFSKVFVLTPFDQGYAIAKGLHNTLIMPNPNTFDSITKEEYAKTFSRRKNILACGRIYQWKIKGFDMAIEAFSKIAYKFPDVDLDIAGSFTKDSKQQLEDIAQKFGVRERVHILGRREDIDELMKQHKLFILSSRTEGFPMVITEAMSQGLPCISFERLASSIILDGVDGCLVPDGSVEGLENKIATLLCNEKVLHNLGLNAIGNVERFSNSNIAIRWEQMIQKQLLKDV